MGASSGVAAVLAALKTAFAARFPARLTAIAGDGGPTLSAPRSEDYRVVEPDSAQPWRSAKRPHVGFSWIADGPGDQPLTRAKIIRGDIEVTLTVSARTEEEAEQHARYYGLAAQQAMEQIHEGSALVSSGLLSAVASEPELGQPLENEHTARTVTIYARSIIQSARIAA